MKIFVNGEATETQARDLAGLLIELGVDARVVATAVNGDFAPKTKRAETPLKPDDAVDVVAPMKGG